MSYEILDDINLLHANLKTITCRTNNNNYNNNNDNDIFEQIDNMIIRPFNNDFVLFIYQLLIHQDNNNQNKATTIKILSLLLTYNIEKYNIFHLTTVESIKLLFTLMERYDNNHHQYEISIIIIEWIHKSLLFIFDKNKTDNNDIFDSNYQSTQELMIYMIIDYLVVTIASDDLSLSHTSYSLIELIIIHSTENNNNSSNDNNNNNDSNNINHNNIIIHKLYKYSEKYKITSTSIATTTTNNENTNTSNIIIYLRYINLLCKIAIKSINDFYECLHYNLIDDILLLCVKDDDILLQINVIDLLIIISEIQVGLEYLNQKGIIIWLINMSCGYLKFTTTTLITTSSSSSCTGSHNNIVNINNNNDINTHIFNQIQGQQIIDPLYTMNNKIDPLLNLTSIDPLLKIEAMRVLGSIFTKSTLVDYNLLHHVDHTYILHFLLTIQQYLDDGDEASKLSGKYLYILIPYYMILLYYIIITTTTTTTTSSTTTTASSTSTASASTTTSINYYLW
jgi:hypothetical protein